ncbi:glycoside hydrolase family 16 protein [Halorubellus salinus]|uniref:glycoside hydrolase family 16 protein n=1 Tax=Halorubellus salinus TaxID=755309 RepID=UPI001D089138|nr:family 16 glycosylhydrolase [Halorubellus salinus]
MGAPGSKITWARERHVNVRDSMLVLTASHEDWESNGVLYAGNVHSKDKVTVEPPVYFEARCNFIQGVGWQNAFWSKPNDEAWPPEIDVVEYLQPSASRADESSHNLHYAASGIPGDSSTHRSVNGSHEYSSESEWPGNTFHVYGVEWREDAIRHYVDGQLVEETTDPDVLESFNRGGPEYLMLSLNLDNVGTTDKSVSWEGREYLTDWVRVWDYTPDSSDGGDTDTSESHYVWVRSANGEEATFAFRAGDGNIRLDDSGQEADYWIADDGMTAGGSVARTSSLPGFRIDGPITDLAYDGPLEIYVDDQQVDPDTLVDPNTEGPTDPNALPNTVTIDGSPYSETASYSVTVSDSIEPAKEMNQADSIDGATATGTVGGGSDKYAFSGSIASLSVDGKADVRLNGLAVDELVVRRSSESSGTVSYIVETTGRLMQSRQDGATIDSSDAVDSSKAKGRVDADADAFWLVDGDVVDVSTFGGSVVTELNGTVIDRTD